MRLKEEKGKNVVSVNAATCLQEEQKEENKRRFSFHNMNIILGSRHVNRRHVHSFRSSDVF